MKLYLVHNITKLVKKLLLSDKTLIKIIQSVNTKLSIFYAEQNMKILFLQTSIKVTMAILCPDMSLSTIIKHARSTIHWMQRAPRCS